MQYNEIQQMFLLFLSIPLISILFILCFRKFKENIAIASAFASFIFSLFISQNTGESFVLAYFSDSLHISFKIDQMSVIFGMLVTLLWSVSSVYAVGYLKTNDKAHKNKHLYFYICFSLAIFSTLGIAFSGDLLTSFLFYELLTFCTYPLVVYKGDGPSIVAGRIYLGVLFGASAVLFLPAILIVMNYNHSLDFESTSGMMGNTPEAIKPLVLVLFVYGIAKAALVPLHFWLPRAMVAPTPVSALLHAVAVVKSGVFLILKVIIYVFGVHNLSSDDFLSGGWLQYVAGFTVILSSIIALKQDNLKKLLAYSTISQLSYVIITASIFTKQALNAAMFQLIIHAISKITLFFVAGNIYTLYSKQLLSEMKGIGRSMPVSMFCFSLAAFSMIGIPPAVAFWGKFAIFSAASNSNNIFVISIMVVSTVLNAMYFIPIIHNAYRFPDEKFQRHTEHSFLMLCSIIFTSLLILSMFFCAGDFLSYINLHF